MTKKLVIGITSYKIDQVYKLTLLTQMCIKSVFDNIRQINRTENKINVEVVLVDAMSNLDNVKLPSELNIIKDDKCNLSYAWNKICDYSFYDVNCDCCLILNNDIILTDNSLEILMKFVTDNKQYGIIFGSEKVNNEQTIEGYMFSCFFMTKELYEKVGRFDEKLPFYANDWDYLERCKSEGISPYYYRPFVVEHYNSTTKFILEDIEKERMQKIHNDSVRYYREKWKGKNVKLP